MQTHRQRWCTVFIRRCYPADYCAALIKRSLLAANLKNPRNIRKSEDCPFPRVEKSREHVRIRHAIVVHELNKKSDNIELEQKFFL